MLKLELDWAAEEPAPVGVDEQDEHVRVELVSESGPAAGWPVIAVYVAHEEGAPAYVAWQRLDSWLTGVYGASEDEAQDLADLAHEV